MIRHLVVVHYHLRPGGVRRIIELALPAIAAELRLATVTLVAGEAAPDAWIEDLRRSLERTELRVRVEPTFRYASEQRTTTARRARLKAAITRTLADADALWLHNPGLARNLPLVDGLTAAARARGVRALFHHHDFWFENRWARAEEFAAGGHRSLDAVARTIFPDSVPAATINRFDQRLLPGSRWLPNLASPAPRPAARKVQTARRWLHAELGDDAPVWIFPTRLLRRKNLAEAVLLTRWLRPEAWLVTTAGVSSSGERPYAMRLAEAARRGRWRVRFSLRAGREEAAPAIDALTAAAEVMVMTSVQEGFGLPYLEAAQAGRPLLARALPNVEPDLRRIGFRLPHLYDEIWIAPDCLDLRAERQRQASLWRRWRAALPRAVRALAEPPLLLGDAAGAVPFGRLTLAGQLEVLAVPPAESWAACAPLNPPLRRWRKGPLRPAAWPAEAARWLEPEAYARRFARALKGRPASADAAEVQRRFIAQRLGSAFMIPILMEDA